MKIQLHQVSKYLYDGERLMDSEYETARTLLNNQLISITYVNASVFKKIRELPECKQLYCGYQLQLTRLPLLNKCEYLECNYNQITELPPLPICTYLNCSYNQITELPPLPICTYLDCSYNQITVLPPLDICTHLNCYHNQITVLPPLPICDYLNCSYNQITVLPSLICTYLDCCNNQITVLPPLPICKYLNCSYNQITVLPPLPRCHRPIFHHNLIRSPQQIRSQHRKLIQQLLLIRSYLSGDIDKIQDSVTKKTMVDYLTKSNLPGEFKDQSTVDFLLPHNLPFATATRQQLLCVFKILREKKVMDNKKGVQLEQTKDIFGNVIVDPVMGDDGLIYDRSSMQQYFRKDSRGDYVNIGYKYQGGYRVPNFKNMGGEKQLTRYQ